MDAINLLTLPQPAVVQSLSFEQILAEHKADLLARYPACADVLDLESEPLVKLIQTHAYRELLYRQRVNESALANLLAFATGTDLDHKGAFYNLARLAGEGDDRYRTRIQLRIAALAGHGTAEHYRLLAMSTSLNVRDVSVRQPVPGQVAVVLWLVDPALTTTTVAAVDTALNAEGARMVGVPVSISVAVSKAINITAQIWRDSAAPSDLVTQIQQALPAQIASYASLGRDVPKSWITTRIHVAGVARVVFPDASAPLESTVLGQDEYPVLGTCNLTDMGIA